MLLNIKRRIKLFHIIIFIFNILQIARDGNWSDKLIHYLIKSVEVHFILRTMETFNFLMGVTLIDLRILLNVNPIYSILEILNIELNYIKFNFIVKIKLQLIINR